MQRALGNQRVVILASKVPRVVQGPGNHADGLELRPRIANRFLVDGKGLRKELVADLLRARLVGNLSTAHKQPQAQLGRGRHPRVQRREAGMHKLIEGRRL